MIAVKDLKKTYGMGAASVEALKGVSFSLARGGFASIMGKSGSGKSTLLNILGCLDTQTSGEYTLNGFSALALNDEEKARLRNRVIGFVFQSFYLLPALTAYENVELPLIYRGDKKAERREKTLAMLHSMGLYERRNHLSNQLSGGQRQRVAIGRALICDPSVIFADEPTGNLDTRTGLDIMELICAMNEGGATVVLITHEPDIAAYARHRYVLSDGMLYSEDGHEDK